MHPVAPVVRTGPADPLASPFDVTGLATDAVVACAEAAAALANARGLWLAPIEVDTRAVATAVSSERHLRIDGRPPALWAPLSGFFPTADGWVRLHGNYPHHAAAIRFALGLPPDAGAEETGAALRRGTSAGAESAVVGAGGVATAVRTEDEWRATEQGRAGSRGSVTPSGGGRRDLPPFDAQVTGPLPAAGVRVLDLTRVLAGPVAGRTLALWGAQVLRLDRPDRPEIDWQHVDLDPGKRTALLDVRNPDDAARFRELAATADVVLLGYRPGALHRLGFGGADLIDAFPHLVVVELSAWGWTGPWAGRRGFDSIVQAACGIAATCAEPPGLAGGGRPGALPAQVLDHSTGYRAAAAALTGLRERPEQGGRLVRLSLLGAAEDLLARPRSASNEPPEPFDAQPFLGTAGAVRYARPPFRLDGRPMDHPFPARPFGRDEPAWSA